MWFQEVAKGWFSLEKLFVLGASGGIFRLMGFGEGNKGSGGKTDKGELVWVEVLAPICV